jgi:hypothetical protein
MCFDPIVEYWRLYVDLVLYMLKVEKFNENVAFNCKKRANSNEKCGVLYLIKNTSQLIVLHLVTYYNPNLCTIINYGSTNTKPTKKLSILAF